MARANQVQAAGLTDPDQCAKHLQLAMRCNQAAETAAGAERGVRAIWEQRAELNRLAGNETDALTLLEKASKVALRVDRDYFMLGHKYAMEGNFRKALPLLQEATRQNPRNFAAWFVRGNCHFEMVQDAQAVGCFNVCVGLQPNFHWAWYNRGLAYARQRNLQQAQADFRHTIELQPEVAKLYVSRARIALELKEPKDAIQDLDKALDLGAPAYAYFLRARARMAAGDKAGAKADHAKGLQEEPNDEKSCVEQGLALVNTDPKRALAAFDKALEINRALSRVCRIRPPSFPTNSTKTRNRKRCWTKPWPGIPIPFWFAPVGVSCWHGAASARPHIAMPPRHSCLTRSR